MPGLSTIVAQTGWKVSRIGDLLLSFLDEAEPLLLPSASYPHGARERSTNRELSGLASVTSLFSLKQMSLPTGNFLVTYIYLR
jgi:hypothetical protein